MKLAKRKNRTSGLKLALKYELYGIAILVLSVIALSQAGSFARSMKYLFRFFVGAWDFVIPLYFIYIGLYVMMKREWPRFFTVRKTGFMLILLGLLMMSHISLFKQLFPQGDFTAGIVIRQTWDNMIEALPVSPQGGIFLEKNVGGGMIGALLYGLLFLLFDDLGARLIEFALFVVGFVLVTGISLVEAGANVKKRVKRLGNGIGAKFDRWSAARKRARRQRALAPPIEDPDDADDGLLMDDGFDEEPFMPPLRQKSGKRRPVFFQLLQSSKKQLIDVDAEPVNPADGAAAQDALPWREDGEAGEDREAHREEASPVEPIPLIRDFQDHVDEADGFAPDEDAAAHVGGPAEAEAEETDAAEESTAGEPAGLPAAPPYQLPPLSLLSRPAGYGKNGEQADHMANARKLEMTLESFGVRAKVLEVVRGPAVTRYEIQPDVGVKVSRIVSLTDDIALALAAKDIRMEAPIPGKSAIGIEVPNAEVAVVTLREVMESSAFHESASKLTIALGRDISGKPIVGNLARMPHLLVAGATGSGKSVCINGIITSILFKAKPDEVKFLMIDPKMVELNVYNGIPHLLAPVVTDPRRASLALKKVVVEMEKRYDLFSKSGTRNIESYNAMIAENGGGEPLPFIVVIVDELADLMMVAASDVEDSICRLAQMARAAGIHLIIATQRPSVDVITGLIKANIPSRIAFGVSSQVDSRTILDMAGAEKLLGRGDMLFLPMGANKPVRVQGAFLSDHEVEAVVRFVSSQGKADYREELVPEAPEQEEPQDEFADELYDQAVQIVLEAKQASVSLLQRRMRIGYTRAARLIDAMEAKGVVGPYEGSRPREVRMTLEQYQQQNRLSS
mgnify:CR=1 FL=1